MLLHTRISVSGVRDREEYHQNRNAKNASDNALSKNRVARKKTYHSINENLVVKYNQPSDQSRTARRRKGRNVTVNNRKEFRSIPQSEEKDQAPGESDGVRTMDRYADDC